jgi:hypothetical protein
MLTPRQIVQRHLPAAYRQLMETAALLDAYTLSVRHHGPCASSDAQVRQFREGIALLVKARPGTRLEDALAEHFYRGSAFHAATRARPRAACG